MAPIKVGLIGYGSSVRTFHLPFILPNPDLEVVAFLQRRDPPADARPGSHCTVDYPHTRHHKTSEAFFADEAIELVVVCSHVDTHGTFAQEALQAGKHVVVEKPFTVTSAEADSLIALAKTQDRILTVYQNRRYDSDFRTLRHLIGIGAFGRITSFDNYYDVDNPAWASLCDPPKPGDGMMYGLGSHSIDQTLLLFGLPTTVTAFMNCVRPGSKADDAFTIVLQYGGEQSELVSTIKTTLISAQPLQTQLKFYVRGTQGTFVKTGEDPQIDQFFSGMKPTDPAFGVEPDQYHGWLSTRKPLSANSTASDDPSLKFDGKIKSQKGSYMDFYANLVAAVRDGKELSVKPEESRNGIRLIELARESAEKGVTVSWC